MLKDLCTDAKILHYKRKKPAALLQRVSLIRPWRCSTFTWEAQLAAPTLSSTLSCKMSDCERSEFASFAQGEVSYFSYCRGT